MVLSLAPLLLEHPLLGRLSIFGDNHHCLGGRPIIVFQRRVLSARLYSSSIVRGRSSDRDWKKGVVGPKLLQKFWRIASMLYTSICWTACPNLLVKSRIDLSSRLKIVCSELMFPFCWTEHKYWETNTTHNSLNEFMNPLGSLWNQARVGPFRLAGNTLHRRRSIPALRIIAWL